MKPEIQIAKTLFSQKKYRDAKNIFMNENMLYEAGLCTLLLGFKDDARLMWNEVSKPDIASGWGLIVLDLINFAPAKKPGFFQVRAFLEIYINLFIENEFLDWAENIISSYKFLLKSNQEVPKFIARSLFSNGYFDLVHEFAEIAKKVCYFDPEIHFIEAQTFYLEKNNKEAQNCLEETLRIAPEYFPALNMRGKIVQ